MKTNLHSLKLFAAVLSLGTVMFAGCSGDDDDNATPSNTKGGSTAKGGGSGKGGGTDNEGGAPSSSGGTGNSSGGKTATPEGGNTGTEGGIGGQPTSSEGGSTATSEGGSAGEPNLGPPPQPDCDASRLKGNPACYKDCDPVKTDDSKYFLNHCGAEGVECTPFDNSTLSKLVNGKVPALPQ